MPSVKKVLSVIVIILSLLTLKLHANDKEALRLCDAALTDCEQVLKSKNDVIDSQEELLKKMAEQRNEAFDRLADEGSNTPWYLMIIIGVAGGVILSNTVLAK